MEIGENGNGGGGEKLAQSGKLKFKNENFSTAPRHSGSGNSQGRGNYSGRGSDRGASRGSVYQGRGGGGSGYQGRARGAGSMRGSRGRGDSRPG